MADSTPESMDCLKALEEKVSEVSREIADLRKKNRSLVSKVNRLEREARGRAETEASRGAAEQPEIRDRIEKLAKRLESLLDET